ncbi:MAG: tandem-95 repeat protein [Caldilineaceae bacterium]|nr:tandem-95 repeat protein [Caldilineaceae bacterium]
MTWSASAEPAHGSVTIDGDGPSRAIVYTPDADFNGSDSFTITVDDGQGGQTSTVVSVNVLAVNDAPIPGADTARTDETRRLTVDVLANDSDIDDETLTLAGVDPPANGSAALVDGSIVYTPTADFAGSDAFAYTVEDSEGLTATAEIAVTVAPVNDAPVMAQGATARVTMSEDGDPRPFELALAATDADNDELTWSASTEPAHGSVTIDGDGLSRAIVYTPDADFNGSDSFTITVDDGQGGQASTVVSVNVLAVNDAPTPGADIARTDEDTPVTVDVLANDSDIDGESLTVAGVDAPGHGTAALVDGSIVYTPTADFAGSDSFAYTVADRSGLTATAQLRIAVAPVNDAPVMAQGATARVTMSEDGVPIPFRMTLEAADVDDSDLTWSTSTEPAHGSVTIDGDGLRRAIVYTPDADFNGSDSFTITVDDGQGGQASTAVA